MLTDHLKAGALDKVRGGKDAVHRRKHLKSGVQPRGSAVVIGVVAVHVNGKFAYLLSTDVWAGLCESPTLSALNLVGCH